MRRREQMRDRKNLGGEATRERQLARQVLIERSEPAVLASQLTPPSYVVKELGERPTDPEKAKAWDKGVRSIETFRHTYGVTDADKALGSGREGSRDMDRGRAESRLRETRRRLERQQQLDRSMNRGREMSHGHDFGIGR